MTSLEERNAMRSIVRRNSVNDQCLILEKWKVLSRNLGLILNVKTARSDATHTARKNMTKHHSSDPRKLVLEKVIVEFITCTRSTFSKHGIGIMQA